MLVVVKSDDEKKQIIELKSKIKLKIFQKILEQKIDITVATELETETDEFLISIKDSRLRILKPVKF